MPPWDDVIPDEDIAGFQTGTGCFDRVADEGGEVIAGFDFGET